MDHPSGVGQRPAKSVTTLSFGTPSATTLPSSFNLRYPPLSLPLLLHLHYAPPPHRMYSPLSPYHFHPPLISPTFDNLYSLLHYPPLFYPHPNHPQPLFYPFHNHPPSLSQHPSLPTHSSFPSHFFLRSPLPQSPNSPFRTPSPPTPYIPTRTGDCSESTRQLPGIGGPVETHASAAR